jgi:hypothetical protein
VRPKFSAGIVVSSAYSLRRGKKRNLTACSHDAAYIADPRLLLLAQSMEAIVLVVTLALIAATWLLFKLVAALESHK